MTIPKRTMDDVAALTELHRHVWTQLGHISDEEPEARQAATATIIIQMERRGTLPPTPPHVPTIADVCAAKDVAAKTPEDSVFKRIPGTGASAVPCVRCKVEWPTDELDGGECPKCRNDMGNTPPAGAPAPSPATNTNGEPLCPECHRGYCGAIKAEPGRFFPRCYNCQQSRAKRR